MSNTLLPFLYQTRTLQRLARPGVSTRACRALLHSTAQNNRPRPRPPPRRPDDIPFELPDDYEYPNGAADEQDAESGVRSTITPQEKDVFNRIFEEIATRKSTLPPLDAPLAPKSPASDSFESLLADLDVSPADPMSSSFDFLDFDEPATRSGEPDPKKVRNTINVILQDAADLQTQSRRQVLQPYDHLHPLDQAQSATEWEKALLRFPPSLRKAARIALGTIEKDRMAAVDILKPTPAVTDEPAADGELMPAPRIELPPDPLAKSVHHEVLRRHQRQRVEAKMEAAATDFELWDVLEAEVFPMVQRLGIIEAAPGRASSTSTTTTKKTKKPKPELPLAIYGPLYPAYLLRALRLFDTQFARSSPLALHILPRVKALGPASYVLGVSTPFYNELARILWNRHGDPAAVFNLLEEMRVAGLYCDEGTGVVVRSIERFFASVVMGRWGPFLREVASLPEYEYAIQPRIRHWLKTIDVHIFERKSELAG